LHPRTDNRHLAPLLIINVIDAAAFDDLHGMNTSHASVSTLYVKSPVLVFVFRVGRRTAPDADGVLSAHKTDTGYIIFNGFHILRFQPDLTTGGQPHVRHLRGALNPDIHTVRTTGKTFDHAVFETFTGTEQHRQHEDSPELTKRRKRGAQFMLAQSLDNFLPLFRIDNHDGQSARMASMGIIFAACSAGISPASAPTTINKTVAVIPIWKSISGLLK